MPNLQWNEVRQRAIQFSRDHARDRSEVAEKQTFWNEFFNVFGLRRASLASFEANVTNLKGNKGSIDLLWRGKLLVEHKTLGEDLSFATTQAFTYIDDLTRENRWDEIPRFVLVSDFANFVLYDLEPDEQRDLPLFAVRSLTPHPHNFTLADFPQHIRHFAFMIGQTRVRLDPEDPANEKAYKRMCGLHDSLLAGGFSGHDLEQLLVRVLFCLFAEDTALFDPDVFTQFVRTQTRPDGADLGAKLNELFDWLNRPEAAGPLDDTDPFYGFRYINGGLFQERLSFARFTRDMHAALLFCCEFQWAKISPAVFGSLFQGVMEDSARRQQGAHYTNERDIMKVIRSLFLDELLADWKRLSADRSTRRRAAIESFHERLRSLHFLDPACGCGNFLVLAYRELRLLEIEVVRELAVATGGQQRLPDVNVDQFHGIELSEWPVRIAEVALWLMDHQMNQQASDVFARSYDRLPLSSSPHIVHDNALRVDWDEVLPRENCSYVLGNPPFVGHHLQNADQRRDQELNLGRISAGGVLDYVCNWYVKAAEYIQGVRVPVAFVSTNSISQGEQPGILWSELFHRYHLKIHFAHRTFDWESEARGKANVDVVIIGFGAYDVSPKRIYDYEHGDGTATVTPASNISPYLFEGSDAVLLNRSIPLCKVPGMRYGNKPTDGGNFVLTPSERSDFLRDEPESSKFIHLYIGADEFLEGKLRYCLWLKDITPAELRSLPKVLARVAAVKDFRLKSKAATTRRYANYPTRFRQIAQPNSEFILVPGHTSEDRKYIPFAYFGPDTIVSNACFMIPDATPYHFGILTSIMHMAWVRTFCGRLESRYRYSKDIVYNNFPWPSPTSAQLVRVEEEAAAVLAARELYLPPSGMSTLADLYDPLTMPVALAAAHSRLDRAVEKCYRHEEFHSDRERVEYLFRLYEQFATPLLPATLRSRRRARA
jgi:hypothetical protein